MNEIKTEVFSQTDVSGYVKKKELRRKIRYMITLEKLKIYEKYAGDDDHFARIGNHKESELFNGNSDWYEINNFKQDIHLITKNLASEKYKQKVIEKLKLICDEQTFNIFAKSIL